ncbi:Ribonucleotide reductase of class Ia (aerobic), beta subunit [hydrothermal vent metagenome]|uniref:Ribonucleotide reductase of class Ia (Aerobic), beta subunit n=1 Tax=hydrothermal vent metagenome TaxID=652676 RepID=A0A3B1D6Z5_9ZZZZ
MLTEQKSSLRMTRDLVSADNKKIMNNDRTVDCNQLVPIKYQWAWHYYLDGCANHWMPTEVSMQRDIEQWKDPKGFTDEERHVIKRVFGFFSTAESLVGNNIVLAVYRHVDNPECRQYLLRQAFEEAIHIHAFQYIVQSLSLEESEIFNMYREVPEIYNKDEFTMVHTDKVLEPNFETKTISGKQEFIENLLGLYVITEGIFFYSGFVIMLSFGRQNRLPGTCEQIQYILRDESIHMNFGIELLNTIVDEDPDVWTPSFQEKIKNRILEAVEVECAYAQECLPNGILGLNMKLLREYVQHIADRRLEKIRLTPHFGSPNPFPWMSEVIDLKKEKNFFETRVTEYQSGGALEW